MIRKLFNMIQLKLFQTQQQRVLSKYYLDGGDYELRYDYDLTADSLVLDLGGYQGNGLATFFHVTVVPFIYLNQWHCSLSAFRKGSLEIQR